MVVDRLTHVAELLISDSFLSKCAYGLRCFQRNPYTLVPGCAGGESDSSYSDYCVDSDDIARDEAISTGSSKNNIFSQSSSANTYPSKSEAFRLKLYWENGYYWQESDRELEFCMMYSYRANTCWYGLRRETCDMDKVYISECSDDPRQTFSFEYLPGNRKEVLIQIGNGLHNTCLERSGRDIALAWCDSTSPLQRWYSPNGDFDSYRFEISQYDYSSQCVTQAHHPKEGEVVELHSCRGSRRDQTSFWNKY
jgi:hypothetical protein